MISNVVNTGIISFLMHKSEIHKIFAKLAAESSQMDVTWTGLQKSLVARARTITKQV